MLGENFTSEFKYPIKIYRIWKLEFANGLEMRKFIFAMLLAVVILISYAVLGIKSDTNFFRFIKDNWLIILVIVPSLITFIVFNLQYDHKNIIPFIRDRIKFYKNRKKLYEHFIAVPEDQLKKELKFESFIAKGDS